MIIYIYIVVVVFYYYYLLLKLNQKRKRDIISNLWITQKLKKLSENLLHTETATNNYVGTSMKICEESNIVPCFRSNLYMGFYTCSEVAFLYLSSDYPKEHPWLSSLFLTATSLLK